MLTHAQMVAAINDGGIVLYRGRQIRAVIDLPSDNQITTDNAADAAAGIVNAATAVNIGDLEIGTVELKDATSGNRAHVNADGQVSVNVGGLNINPGDISIGAIEIKDDTADTRANVKTDGTNNALVVTQNAQPLPSGASTAARQDVGNASLASIDTKIPALSSGKLPVTNPSALPLPSGAATETTLAEIAVDTDNLAGIKAGTDKIIAAPATEAKQDTANTSLASLDTKSPDKGQAAMAASVPVVLASDQSPVPTNLARSSAANTPSILTTGGDAKLAANANRKAWRIQNLGTNILFILLAAAGASSTVFHVALRGGTANDDALGGVLEDESWIGAVSIAGTSPRYALTELS